MESNNTPTLKYRVEVVRNGRYHCVKVTLNHVAAKKAADTYAWLGYLTRVKAKEVTV